MFARRLRSSAAFGISACVKKEIRPLPLRPARTLNFSTTHSRQTITASIPLPPTKRSFLRRTARVFALAVLFSSAGFIMSVAPVVKAANGYLNPPSDEETLTMFTPSDDVSREVEEFIKNHPIAVELRSQPEYSESRPHLKIPEGQRSHNLTGGTLLGPGRVVVPPFVWSERGGKSLVSISYLGEDLCGHPGLVHGGLLATLLDEGLARCCFAALPNKVGMTANLNINYRNPTPAGGFVVLRAVTTKVEGRKAWVEGRIETLVAEGEKPVVLAEATALFIEPRQAASMARVYPVQ
ncbi:related to Found in Mitochondrial Proteome [Phialocephala subalpina]|uniref:Related to Found in Mitochondrial Proteome n=1 Tax=Phialocephala subalpina TaxID=576137 RepID=A0A1L7XYK4_9HELO|nr:related to Found in Mitochondrial Proteome [Phialocephala subalpina]